jgi:signal transduction histidine kinase
MSTWEWFRPARRILVSCLAVTMLPAAGLFWLSWRSLTEERLLDEQRIRYSREQAADLIVAALQQKLGDVERDGSYPDSAAADDAIAIEFTSSGIKARPSKRLVFEPAIPTANDLPLGIFTGADEFEFRRFDYHSAIAALRPFTLSPDPRIRGAARMRIARNLRKAGDLSGALDEWRRVADLGSADLEGAPAELVAGRARYALLLSLKRVSEANRIADELSTALNGGRRRQDRATYEHYLGELHQAPSQPAVALATAVERLWVRHRESPSGREFAGAYVLAWRGSTGFVAGPRFAGEHWIGPLGPLLQTQGVRLLLNTPSSPREARRPPSSTGLPWDIAIAGADPEAELRQFTARRWRFLALAGLLTVSLCAGSYLIARAVNRELAVARLQSDFVAAVSHEFRTPLTLLRQTTEIFLEDRAGPGIDKRKYYVAQARATDRLQRLVESLLDFGRMEAGAKPYRMQLMDAREIVARTINDFHRETGADVRVSTADSPLPVECDPDALHRAVWNLLDNAVKYSPAGRAVTIETGRSGSDIAIRVRDQGPGIPLEERTAIFRKFVRGAASRTNGVKGTGIGLAMVLHIIQAHRGRITVEDAPGVGSEFTILLPERSAL